MRALLVALLVATPSLLLPGNGAAATEIIALLALLGATLTFIEYNSHYPSFLEFRDAPPLNRIRFFSLFLTVFAVTVMVKHRVDPNSLTAIVNWLAGRAADATDFPYSPVRLVLLMLPQDVPLATHDAVRSAAGLAYLLGLATVAAFVFVVRVLHWPTGPGAFNVWVNLPLFDPTAGGDVVHRLQRDGRVNIVIGVLLPFAIPAVVKAAAGLIGPVTFAAPHTMVWAISVWAFLPGSLILRGIAMLRIAELIDAKRRRAYAAAAAAAAQGV